MFDCLMVHNATFNNILVISWRSVLLVEETGGPGENHRTVASHWQTCSHNVVHLALIEIRTHNFVVIGTDCIGSCKSNYHVIMATTAPYSMYELVGFYNVKIIFQICGIHGYYANFILNVFFFALVILHCSPLCFVFFYINVITT
jgi:hypothetical protein